MSAGYWTRLNKIYTDLPDYDKDVLLTVKYGNQKEVTLGKRTHTDKHGEHWSFMSAGFTEANITVLAWKDKPEPFKDT